MIRSFRVCGLTNIFNKNSIAKPVFHAAAIVPQALRQWNGGQRLSSGRPEKSEFEQRAIELLKGFEKIDPAKVNYKDIQLL